MVTGDWDGTSVFSMEEYEDLEESLLREAGISSLEECFTERLYMGDIDDMLFYLR